MGILSNLRTVLAAAALLAPGAALTLSYPILNPLAGTAHAAELPADGATFLNIVAASASDYDASSASLPELAIDGNLDTKWTTLSMPQWFTADLGAAQLVSFLRMNILVTSNGSRANFAVDVSEDNENWTNVLADASLTAEDGWVSAGIAPMTARYVRIRLNSSDITDATNLYELEIYGQVLPAEIATVNASDFDASRDRFPEKAIDGNLSSKWTALSLPQWITMDLGAAMSVSGTSMMIHAARSGINASYSVDVSMDNVVWTTVLLNASLTKRPSWTDATFDPVAGRYVRIRLDSSNRSEYVNLYELMVYAQSLSSNPTIPDIGNEDPAIPDTGNVDPAIPDTGNEVPVVPDISNIKLTLNWLPVSGTVQGYKVFFGPTTGSMNSELSDITNTISTSFNPASPSIRYDSWFNLRLLPGDTVCFQLRAYNSGGISSGSAPVCSVIPEMT